MAKKYTEHEITRILRALVLADGKPSKAKDRLAAMGEQVPLRTIQELRNTHADKYDNLHATRARWFADEIATQSEAASQLYGQGAERLAYSILRTSDETLDELSPNVKAQAIRALSLAKGVEITKATEARAAPLQDDDEETVTMAELMRGIQRLIPAAKAPLIEATVVDESD